MAKVLLTTSGIGSRLGNLTKYTNKSLVRIGRKPAISYIVENYPRDTHFVLTLGHYGDQVRQYFQLAHPDLNVTFVEVDKYDGPGSSLLYSISRARKELDEPFVFHACDTVVHDPVPTSLTADWLGGFRSRGSSHYRTFNVAGLKVLRLNDKGEKTSDYDYIGILGVKHFDRFWKHAETALRNGGTPSDYEVILAMMEEGIEFQSQVFHTWDDIGNIDSLRDARSNAADSFDLLDKDDESIFLFDDKVIKFFYNSTVCKNRVERAKQLAGMVPEVIGATENFYSYRYVPGDLLSRVITAGKMKRLLDWAGDNLWKPVADDGKYASRCMDFYKAKTLERVNRFLENNRVADTAGLINGENVPPVRELIDKIPFSELCSGKPTVFHGDFILENLLETKSGFAMLDWRQDFGGTTAYGDFHYDLAKLNHNLTLDHNAIYHNLYSSTDGESGRRVEIMIPSIGVDCREVLKQFCAEHAIDWRKIYVLTSLVWLNMSPLHERPLDMFLFYFGKYHLFLALKSLGYVK